MEDQLLVSLELDPGAALLDAGCGVGHVAIYLAQSGLRVQCIDIVDYQSRRHRAMSRHKGFRT
jgi:sterol 24-C-methyltransferase